MSASLTFNCGLTRLDPNLHISKAIHYDPVKLKM